MGIPHFIAHWEPPEDSIDNPHHNFTRNLYPKADTLAQALFDIVADFEWKSFSVLYENGYSLMRLQDILQAHESLGKAVAIYQLPDDANLKPLLKRISKSGVNRFIVDCGLENLARIIQQGIQFNMTKEYIVSSVIAIKVKRFYSGFHSFDLSRVTFSRGQTFTRSTYPN